jgi:hypothetical protein
MNFMFLLLVYAEWETRSPRCRLSNNQQRV